MGPRNYWLVVVGLLVGIFAPNTVALTQYEINLFSAIIQNLTAVPTSWTGSNVAAACGTFEGVSCDGTGSVFRIEAQTALAFNGILPCEFFRFPMLDYLELHDQTLEGTLADCAADICDTNAATLREIDISDNSLTGPLVNFTKCLTLHTVDLSKNGLSGTIPNDIAHLDWVKFDLHDNELSGTIPAALFNLATIKTIALDGNHLNGTLPPTITGVLERLELSSNLLSGSIPDWAFDNHNFDTYSLKLSFNEFNCPTPAQVSRLAVPNSQMDIHLASLLNCDLRGVANISSIRIFPLRLTNFRVPDLSNPAIERVDSSKIAMFREGTRFYMFAKFPQSTEVFFDEYVVLEIYGVSSVNHDKSLRLELPIPSWTPQNFPDGSVYYHSVLANDAKVTLMFNLSYPETDIKYSFSVLDFPDQAVFTAQRGLFMVHFQFSVMIPITNDATDLTVESTILEDTLGSNTFHSRFVADFAYPIPGNDGTTIALTYNCYSKETGKTHLNSTFFSVNYGEVDGVPETIKFEGNSYAHPFGLMRHLPYRLAEHGLPWVVNGTLQSYLTTSTLIFSAANKSIMYDPDINLALIFAPSSTPETPAFNDIAGPIVGGVVAGVVVVLVASFFLVYFRKRIFPHKARLDTRLEVPDSTPKLDIPPAEKRGTSQTWASAKTGTVSNVK